MVITSNKPRFATLLKVALVCAVNLTAGCHPESSATPPQRLPEVANPWSQRFAARFCYLAAQEFPDKRCQHWLHGAPSAKAAAAFSAPLPRLDKVTTVIVSGLFNDCVGKWFEAFEVAAERLRHKGYRIHLLPVAGRGSTDANATQIIASLRGLKVVDQQMIGIGYSKGANDLLHAVNANLRTTAATDVPPGSSTKPLHLDTLVTLGAAAFGSELMELVPTRIRTTLEKTPFPGCRKAESDVLADLLPTARKAAMEAWTAPTDMGLFSLAAAPTPERVSRILQPSYKTLLNAGLRNDGQVSIRNALAPNAIPLGYLNGDHWAIALPIRDGNRKVVAPLVNQNVFPRTALLQAIIDTVAEH